MRQYLNDLLLFVLPEILEPLRGQLSVSCRVLDVAMAKPLLDGSRVVPIVGPSGMAQHVRVHGEGKHSMRPISYRWRHARRVGCGDDDLRHGERLDGSREIDTTHRRQACPETWRQRCIRAGDHPAADTRASDGGL